MPTETQMQIVASMCECRDILRGLCPHLYADRVVEMQEIIQAVMRCRNLDIIPAAMQICQDSPNNGSRLWAMAAAVEMIEALEIHGGQW